MEDRNRSVVFSVVMSICLGVIAAFIVVNHNSRSDGRKTIRCDGGGKVEIIFKGVSPGDYFCSVEYEGIVIASDTIAVE